MNYKNIKQRLERCFEDLSIIANFYEEMDKQTLSSKVSLITHALAQISDSRESLPFKEENKIRLTIRRIVEDLNLLIEIQRTKNYYPSNVIILRLKDIKTRVKYLRKKLKL